MQKECKNNDCYIYEVPKNCNLSCTLSTGWLIYLMTAPIPIFKILCHIISYVMLVCNFINNIKLIVHRKANDYTTVLVAYLELCKLTLKLNDNVCSASLTSVWQATDSYFCVVNIKPFRACYYREIYCLFGIKTGGRNTRWHEITPFVFT